MANIRDVIPFRGRPATRHLKGQAANSRSMRARGRASASVSFVDPRASITNTRVRRSRLSARSSARTASDRTAERMRAAHRCSAEIQSHRRDRSRAHSRSRARCDVRIDASSTKWTADAIGRIDANRSPASRREATSACRFSIAFAVSRGSSPSRRAFAPECANDRDRLLRVFSGRNEDARGGQACVGKPLLEISDRCVVLEIDVRPVCDDLDGLESVRCDFEQVIARQAFTLVEVRRHPKHVCA